jgi:hypothetical protein
MDVASVRATLNPASKLTRVPGSMDLDPSAIDTQWNG